MMTTLVLIYSVGFGNMAILTEKFENKHACEQVKEVFVKQLNNRLGFIDCVGE